MSSREIAEITRKQHRNVLRDIDILNESYDNMGLLNFEQGYYLPAQKWLKDRKGRKLNFEDIQHYQRIIIALMETDRLMREIH